MKNLNLPSKDISKVNQTLSYLNDLANEFNDPPQNGRNFCGLRYGLYGVEGSSQGWRESFGNLAAWYERIQKRESFSKRRRYQRVIEEALIGDPD